MSVPTEPGAYWWNRGAKDGYQWPSQAVNVIEAPAPIEGWHEAEIAVYDETGDTDAFDHDHWFPRTLVVGFGEFELTVNAAHTDGRKFAHPLGGEWGPRLPSPPVLAAMRELLLELRERAKAGDYYWGCCPVCAEGICDTNCPVGLLGIRDCEGEQLDNAWLGATQESEKAD